ncbi:MAG: hypothetical protein IJ194_04030 [Bacilli bacterium]|nr:hypothetical protein [Bacilli bacterium]
MKKKMILIPLSFLIITSCGGEASTNPSAESTTAETTQTTTENTTPSVATTTKEGTTEEDTTISTEDNTSSEDTSDGSSNVVTAITSATLLPSDLPTTGSGYPDDQTITAKDGISYFISLTMAGNQQTLKGVKTDVIQLKKSTGYFYNEDQPFSGTLTINVLDKGTYTGTPTIYVGSSQHPTTTQKEASVQRGEEFITYTYSIIGEYITLANESSYALYLSSFVLA